jgi:hypothetical protein
MNKSARQNSSTIWQNQTSKIIYILVLVPSVLAVTQQRRPLNTSLHAPSTLHMIRIKPKSRVGKNPSEAQYTSNNDIYHSAGLFWLASASHPSITVPYIQLFTRPGYLTYTSLLWTISSTFMVSIFPLEELVKNGCKLLVRMTPPLPQPETPTIGPLI